MPKTALIAAAAAATALLAVAATTASAQAPQEWRRGTFEERPGAHRFGARCINRVVAIGAAHTSFFSGRQGTFRAERRAIQSWERRVGEKYGAQFANFQLAQGKQNRCVRKGLEIDCTISAHPCSGR